MLFRSQNLYRLGAPVVSRDYIAYGKYQYDVDGDDYVKFYRGSNEISTYRMINADGILNVNLSGIRSYGDGFVFGQFFHYNNSGDIQIQTHLEIYRLPDSADYSEKETVITFDTFDYDSGATGYQIYDEAFSF